VLSWRRGNREHASYFNLNSKLHVKKGGPHPTRVSSRGGVLGFAKGFQGRIPALRPLPSLHERELGWG
jgi:hypothetical protein